MIALDRIEGDRAVLEINGELIDVPRVALPAGAREGDRLVLRRTDTQDRLSEATARMERLTNRNPVPDDFEL